jgi:hypothetical protein
VRAICATSFVLVFAFSNSRLAKAPATVSQPNSSVCGTMASIFREGSCIHVSFFGEVFANRTFEREFGALRFRLNPQTVLFGWNVEVAPGVETGPTRSEYVWVVTPPYHFGNIRYLDTSYGTKAVDAVKVSPRDFNFVLDQEQFDRSVGLVNLAISSHPAGDHKSDAEHEKEGSDAVAALESMSIGKGRLEILDSRVDRSGGDHGLGAIAWLKFKVELHVPCDFAIGDSADIVIDRASCAGKRN